MENKHADGNRNEERTAVLNDSAAFRSINISLDNSEKVYRSKQNVTGKVILDLGKPIDAVGIRINFKGEAQVYFTDRSVGMLRKYSANESYFHEEIYIENDGRKKAAVKSGEYPFSIPLPDNIPCSFEGRYGRIRYSIKAVLDISEDSHFASSIVPFTVVTTEDLNNNTQAQLPITENHKQIFLGQTKPIHLGVDLPVRGFVPGQTMPLKIKLINESNVDLRKLRILFKKVVVYHATEKSRTHKEIIVEIEQPVTKKEETYDVDVDVPAVPPTGMRFCNILDVRYTLKVETRVDLKEWYYRIFHKNLKIRMNVLIGTVPLKYYEKTLEELNVQNSTPEENVLATNEDKIHFANKTELLVEYEKGHYRSSKIYRSSKPDKDDPTGNEDDGSEELAPFSPMYRVYEFSKTRQR